MDNSIANKQAAADFLELIGAHKIDEAYEKYVDMSGKHHNAFTPAGFAALKEGMKGADQQFPQMKLEVLRSIAEDDTVAVHSSLQLDEETKMAAVHIFRFKDGKIIELWDIAQKIDGSANSDGAF